VIRLIGLGLLRITSFKAALVVAYQRHREVGHIGRVNYLRLLIID